MINLSKLASFIVHGRYVFFVLFLGFTAYSIYGFTQVEVESDITAYLSGNTDTKKSLDIMDKQFKTYASITIMVSTDNISDAMHVKELIEGVPEVLSVTFDESNATWQEPYALYSITFKGPSNDTYIDAEGHIKNDVLKGYTVYEYQTLDAFGEFAKQVVIALICVIVIILIVLFLTTTSYAEIIVFPIVFVVAILMNMGTNYWYGTISNISNTVCSILQLALSLDYSIIMANNFTEEKARMMEENKKKPEKDELTESFHYITIHAMINSMSFSIVEIFSSCITTIAGLLTLATMDLRLGADLGFVLAKAIVCSVLCVFFLMPGLLVEFSKLLTLTEHRRFIPESHRLGRIALRVRYILPPLFLVLAIVCGALVETIQDVVFYGETLDTHFSFSNFKDRAKVNDIFGYQNMFAVLVPFNGSYELEGRVADAALSVNLVESVTAISRVPVFTTPEGVPIYAGSGLTYGQMAGILGLEPEQAKLFYAAYAAEAGESPVPDIETYNPPLVDLMFYIFKLMDVGILTLDEPMQSMLVGARGQLTLMYEQLKGQTYTRALFGYDGDYESDPVFDMIDQLEIKVKGVSKDTIFAGDCMSAHDLQESFKGDNVKVTVLTIVFIYVLLVITMRSWGLPILLVAIIQGSVFINFVIPIVIGYNFDFFTYLIVNSLQMSATIDYAIVMSDRYVTYRRNGLPKYDAVVNAVNATISIIITSGLTLVCATLLIGFIISDVNIHFIGIYMGTGTIISLLATIFVFPGVLYLLSPFIYFSSFRTIIYAVNKYIRKKDVPPYSVCDSVEATTEEQENEKGGDIEMGTFVGGNENENKKESKSESESKNESESKSESVSESESESESKSESESVSESESDSEKKDKKKK